MRMRKWARFDKMVTGAGAFFVGILLAATAVAFERVEFEQLDTDGDGVIDRDEAQVIPELAERFDEFDETGSGNLTRQEFEQAVEEIGEYPAETPAVRERWDVEDDAGLDADN